jgi:hypothetical protein
MLGAIVIEQLVDSRAPDGLLQRVDVVRRHSSTALTNAQSHEGLFLLPVWRFIGKSRVLVTARNLPKTILASIAIVALALAAWLVPWDFTIAADGKLLPETRKGVFAVYEGQIIEVPVDDRSEVTTGQVVARQRSLDIEKEIVRLNGLKASTLEQYNIADLQFRRVDVRPDRNTDQTEISGELSRLKSELDSLDRQLVIVLQKKAALEIRSPIDGMVVTRNVRDLLENRSVRPGTELMKIADPSKAWELEVDVPEAKVGHVIRYLRQIRAEDPKAELKVTFMLASYTGVKLEGSVVRIDSSAEIAGDKGNTVRMTVAFDQDELLKLASGGAAAAGAELNAQDLAQLKRNLKVNADVKAKIHCGRAAVGYVLLHDLWEFIQSRILFRF